jgi:predicted dithiol-disulfide oxidoreductase (DUF899 family)
MRLSRMKPALKMENASSTLSIWSRGAEKSRRSTFIGAGISRTGVVPAASFNSRDKSGESGPFGSIVSLLYVMTNGMPAEIAIIGNEGVIGIASDLGHYVRRCGRLRLLIALQTYSPEVLEMTNLSHKNMVARKAHKEAIGMAHEVVSKEEWLSRRLALLKEEMEASKKHDELSKRQRALPWVKIDKNYIFTGPEGDLSLLDLFGGRSQLFIKHFMMAPNQDWQCPGCTLEVAHVGSLLEYFDHHDMSYVAVARAPIAEIEAVKRKMGWKFQWVSSSKSDFNYDFHVSFRPEELKAHRTIYNFREFDSKDTEDLSGNSIFFKDEQGQIFHTYGAFGRGGEQFLGIYGFLDVLPKGREEDGPMHSLPDWAGFKTRGVHNREIFPKG